jgi:hypothetical protein
MRTLTTAQLSSRLSRLEKRRPLAPEANIWQVLAGKVPLEQASPEVQATVRYIWGQHEPEPCPYETRLAEERRKVAAYEAQQAAASFSLR